MRSTSLTRYNTDKLKTLHPWREKNRFDEVSKNSYAGHDGTLEAEANGTLEF